MAAPIELIRGTDRMTVYGEFKLNAALADGWQRVSDLSPQQQAELANRPPAPWKNYDGMGVSEVLAQAKGLPPERIKEIVTYESSTKGRVSIINKLTGRPVTTDTPTEEVPAAKVEKQLEAETGHKVVKTGDNPPTFVETDAPASGGKSE